MTIVLHVYLIKTLKCRIGLDSKDIFPRWKNGIRNIMEDQYPPIYLSIILKSHLARKRRSADGETKRKLADTQTDKHALTDEKV